MAADRPSPNAKQVFWFDDGKTPNVADMLDNEPEVTMHRLEFKAPDARNWPVIEGSHVYCITSTRDEVPDQYKANAAFLKRCPDLLVVSTSGAGYDPVDVAACTAAGVLVVNQTGSNAEAVAEHAVGMMLALTKKMFETDRSLHSENRVHRENFKGWDAKGKTIGLIGLGNTGRRVARICGLGLEMKVIAYDPYITDADFKERRAERRELDELLKEADYVSVHCPYNAETKDMIDDRELALMKPGAFLINCARGGITNEDALARALAKKTIAGAALDVWVQEPPPVDHALLTFDNFIATFHTAGVTFDSRTNMAEWNAEQVLDTLRGNRPPRLINPEAWDAFAKRFEKIIGHPVKG
jgi:D-3-phosphoglycerate dehydrogenase / 2-oxoglutarate reductase